MKKLFIILPFLALPINSMAENIASDNIIDGAVNMLYPSYCNDVFTPTSDQNLSNAKIWYTKAKTIISNCYKQAEANTSLLPRNNPAYQKCFIADFLIRTSSMTIDKKMQREGKKSILPDLYFSEQGWQVRFDNARKGIPNEEIELHGEYYNYLKNTIHEAGDKLSTACARYRYRNGKRPSNN